MSKLERGSISDDDTATKEELENPAGVCDVALRGRATRFRTNAGRRLWIGVAQECGVCIIGQRASLRYHPQYSALSRTCAPKKTS